MERERRAEAETEAGEEKKLGSLGKKPKTSNGKTPNSKNGSSLSLETTCSVGAQWIKLLEYSL
jgi:hypothetical protein